MIRKKKCGCEFILERTNGLATASAGKYVKKCHKHAGMSDAQIRSSDLTFLTEFAKFKRKKRRLPSREEARRLLEQKMKRLGLESLDQLEDYAHRSLDFEEASEIDFYLQLARCPGDRE